MKCKIQFTAKYLTLILLFSILGCEQKYPFDIGNGFKIDYNARSKLALLNKNNSILCDCSVGGYYQDQDIIVIRCDDRWTFVSKKHEIIGKSYFCICRIDDVMTSKSHG